jgi:outer membrane protein assembly factor BamA
MPYQTKNSTFLCFLIFYFKNMFFVHYLSPKKRNQTIGQNGGIRFCRLLDKRWVLLWVFCYVGYVAHTQINIVPNAFTVAERKLLQKKIIQDSWKNVPDTATALQILRNAVQQLQADGYAEAAIDSLEWQPNSSELRPYFHIGERYRWLTLHGVARAFDQTEQALAADWWAQTGYRANSFEDKPLNFRQYADLAERLLVYAENRGYPFAQVFLDSLVFATNAEGEKTVQATLRLDKGLFVRVTEWKVVGTAKISTTFLSRYLDLREGAPLSRSRLLQAEARLRELQYLQVVRSPSVSLRGEAVIITLYLDARASNTIDGIVGVLPSNAADGSTKFTITATGNLDFQNAILNSGERLKLTLEQVRAESPRLELRAAVPYIGQLPFGADIAFDLYKRDTAYLDVRLDLGVRYGFGGNDYLRIFYNNFISNNLALDKRSIIAARQLPTTLDLSSASYGLEYAQERLDYRYNPRKGWAVNIRAAVGTRTVTKNNDVLQLRDLNDTLFNFASLYDTVALSSLQGKILLESSIFLPILRRGTLKLGLRAATLLSNNTFSQNEQYRIGGNRLLRGFDEESIFVTRYAVATVEYRLLLSRNSYIAAFVDAAYVDKSSRNVTTLAQDFPYGLGAAITFETKVGLFAVTLAVGKQQQNALDLRNVKFHFGYVSLF